MTLKRKMSKAGIELLNLISKGLSETVERDCKLLELPNCENDVAMIGLFIINSRTGETKKVFEFDVSTNMKGFDLRREVSYFIECQQHEITNTKEVIKKYWLPECVGY